MDQLLYSIENGGRGTAPIGPTTNKPTKNVNVTRRLEQLTGKSIGEIDDLLRWYASTIDDSPVQAPTRAELMERSSILHRAFVNGLSECAGHKGTPEDLKKADELIERLGLNSYGPS